MLHTHRARGGGRLPLAVWATALAVRRHSARARDLVSFRHRDASRAVAYETGGSAAVDGGHPVTSNDPDPPVPPAADDAANERDDPGAGAPFPIVGVGASAGGLEAFTELLNHLPTDTGMGFVLVQHLAPQHDSALTHLLTRATSMPVREVRNDLEVAANCVYVIPPNTNLGIEQGILKLKPRPQTRTPHHSIDFFFEALAHDSRERAIGVVLSGTATDGTLGLEAIKAEGGFTFAQDESARHDSMPQSAVAAGCVDLVLSPEKIAKELARIARHPPVTWKASAPRAEDEASVSIAGPEADRASATAHVEDETPLPSGGRGRPRTGAKQARAEAGRGPSPSSPKGQSGEDSGYRTILSLLHKHSGVDFSLYKSSTIQRRITRRIVLNRQTTIEAYAQFLRGNAKELDALYSDVLISVTSFFRNPEAFEFLKRKVFSTILPSERDQPLRIWTLGCSTGQEAYSVGMAFTEFADTLPHPPRLQIFATDLNDALLDKARAGLYAKSVAADVSPERLRRFFVEVDGGYRVIKGLRDAIVFARQNLLSDPPFSRMNLIVCRNLLIYLEPSLQKKIIPTFHYALKANGCLFLGGSESIGAFTDLFEPLDRKHKIYARRGGPSRALPARLAAGPSAARERSASPKPPGAPEAFYPELNAQREADRVTRNRYAPPSVLIDAEWQILEFRGDTGAYLKPPAGQASFEVLKMAREGLMLPLRAALNKAKKDNKVVRKDGVRVERDGRSHTASLEIVPLKNVKDRCYLIFFEDSTQLAEARAPAPEAKTPGSAPVVATAKPRDTSSAKEASCRVIELETDLAETRDYLQSLQEQQEAALEELQASNEEVTSANEELQSTNEELETSKEELESANEELTTVNEEMANRNAELNRLLSDLSNLQISTRLAIVLLARDLTIRRFSAQAEKQFGLLAADAGRPIGNIRHGLVFPAGSTAEPPDLERFIAGVITDVREGECEVQDPAGRWYSLRVRPYFTHDNKVDGAVLVLVDIDALKRSAREVKAARDYAEAAIRTARDPLVVLRADLRVNTANEAFYRTFKTPPGETEGRVIFELAGGAWRIPKLRMLLEDVLPRNSFFNDFELTHDFPHIGRRTMLLNARRLDQEDGTPQMILLAIEDVTERLHADAATAALAAIVNSSDDAIIGKDLNGVITSWNKSAEHLFGYTAREAIGQPITMLMPPDRQHEEPEILARLKRGEGVDHLETVRVRKDGSPLELSLTISPIEDATGQVIGASQIARDITGRKRAEEALREADRRKDEFLAILAHELRGPLAPLSNMLEIMKRAEGNAELIEQARGTMQRQLAQMTRLIDDLLDASRISRDKLELRLGQVELGSVVHHAVEACREAMDSARHELTVTLPPQPVYLDADPMRLAQVFVNLLSNACKFTEPGGCIALTARQQGGEVVVSVKDSGVGIAPDMLHGIFEMFTQVDRSLDRARGGLGIGLTLVRQLVEMHGGSVTASSEGPGRGAELVVRLPVAIEKPEPALPEAAVSEAAPAPARRILVVDDNQDAAATLAMLLAMNGHETHTAHDGIEAVNATEAFRPDVVLLDIGLPKLNGYEAAQRIRGAPWGKSMMLIALTGWGQVEDRQKSIAAGFDAHLVKPVDHAALAKLLAESRPR